MSMGMANRLLLLLVSFSVLIDHATANNLVERSSSPSPLVPRTWNGKSYGCKCYLGDACWPSAQSWKTLNATVGGNLVVHIPPESVCHNFFNGTLGIIPTYDAAKCADVAAKYPTEQWINDQDALLMWKSWTNSSCTPTTDPATPCTLGYYGLYVIKATKKTHIKAGIDFARRNNLRLIIRNTGHDFFGRSTGWGSLIINTHSFQDVEFTANWKGPGGYTGSAVTVGAGVQGRALLRKAVAQNPPVTVVTGECPTVGIAGGFVQGGGHSPLTTIYGFAADNALSFDVITAQGDFVTANAHKNPDLFYAIKGGGPGAFAAIVSATFKTFPERRSAGAALYINSTLTTDETVLWEGIRIFHSYSNVFVDNGLYVLFSVAPGRIRVHPWVAFNKTAAQLEATLAPMKAELIAAGVPFYSALVKEYTTFFDLYVDLFEDEMAGAPLFTSGWTFGRRDVEENNDGIIDAFKLAISPRPDLKNQGYLLGHIFNVGHGVPVANSATHPRFRDSSDLTLYNLPLPVNASLTQKDDIRNLLVNTLDQAMMEAGPNGCAYINEADPSQPNWQDNFWGPTVYPKLVDAKKKWDPEGIFYTVSTPGTESWEVIEYGTRLCKKLIIIPINYSIANKKLTNPMPGLGHNITLPTLLETFAYANAANAPNDASPPGPSVGTSNFSCSPLLKKSPSSLTTLAAKGPNMALKNPGLRIESANASTTAGSNAEFPL
ncbi:hypothetical protein OQA88_5518 [Cercophora sp. LCS_1]